MTYIDRRRRGIVIFAIVAASLAMLTSSMAVTAVLCIHYGHHIVTVSAP